MRLLRGRRAGESPLGCGGRGTLSGGPEAGVSSDTAGDSLAFGEREEGRETTGHLQSRSLPQAKFFALFPVPRANLARGGGGS